MPNEGEVTLVQNTSGMTEKVEELVNETGIIRNIKVNLRNAVVSHEKTVSRRNSPLCGTLRDQAEQTTEEHPRGHPEMRGHYHLA